MKYKEWGLIACYKRVNLCRIWGSHSHGYEGYYLLQYNSVICWKSPGRDIAQAVSCWLPTEVARVRAQVRSRGIFGGESGTRVGFFQVLRFPLPILIPPTAPHSSSIIRGWYNRPNSGRCTKWTQSHPTPRN
jgi:hypothetical protein